MALGLSIARLGNSLADLFFPVECLGCGKAGDFLCGGCLSRVIINNNFCCPFCGHSSFLGQICFSCSKKVFLDGVWIAGSYENEILQEAIKNFKYKFVKNLSGPLGEILIKFLKNIQNNHEVVLSFDYLVSVPLHKRKLLYRGFNQSEFLAFAISNNFSWPVLTQALERKKFTKSQTELGLKKRKDNIFGAFRPANEKNFLANKRILLVDDVITTGATLDECAKVLKLAGCKKVWAIVLARN